MSLLVYLAAHWGLVIATVLAVLALGVAAFFLKNWKIAVAAVAVSIAGFVYQGAVMSGIQLQMAKDNVAIVKQLKDRLTTMENVSAADTARAIADNEKITELESRASEVHTDNRIGLDAAAVGRVRSIK